MGKNRTKKCKATTKSGSRCTRSAVTEAGYCTQHSPNDVDVAKLQSHYNSVRPVSLRFASAFVHQLKEILEKNLITLGVPIESRVKEWQSVSEKIEQKKLGLHSILQLDDLIGVRLILLFKRDLEAVHSILKRDFDVVSHEDTSSRLDETQFGYQSVHYVIRLPSEWLKVPTFAEFTEYRAELQVRTLSQHIWAAVSHKLQYKNESNVPPPLRRSIHRVSAILEVVDLEFERLLGERDDYVRELSLATDKDALDTELVRKILDQKLPPKNLSDPEDFSALLTDLTAFSIHSIGDLTALIDDNFVETMKREAYCVAHYQRVSVNSEDYFNSRIDRGVYFTHVGLVRVAMSFEFGDKWDTYRVDNLDS